MADIVHQLTLVADERRYDLVVPLGARVSEVLAVLGIPASPASSSVATAGGRVLGPHDRLDERLTPGSVLTVVRTTTHEVLREVVTLDTSSAAPGARPSAPGWAGGARRRASSSDHAAVPVDDATRRRDDVDATVSRATLRGRPRTGAPTSRRRVDPDLGGTLVVGCAAVALAGALLALPSPTSATASARSVVAALLLGTAVVCVLTGPREGVAAAATRLAAAPALAVAAGLTVPLPDSPSRAAVSGVLGAACGAVVLGLGSAARAAHAAGDRAERTAMACLGGLAVILAIGVLLGWPTGASAAVVVGLVPVLARTLPTASLDVDSSQLVDADRLSTTVWAVRERPGGERDRVSSAHVRERVGEARASVSVGTAYLAVIAALGGWALASAEPPSTLAPWSCWVVLLVAATALGYQARSVRDRVARYSMVAVSASLTGSGVVALLGERPSWTWVVAGAALVLALLAIVGAIAVGAGWRSPRLSRLADRAESLAVVVALPLGLVAAGTIEALRRVTSG
ncbi:MAG: hypothetical protein ACRCSN_08375 [Dermatophilaceae bacterium]